MPIDKTPVGIKVISIVFFLCTLFLLAFSIMLFFSFGTLKDLSQYFPFLTTEVAGYFLGTVVLAIAVLFFFIGFDLWRKKRWSRIGAIVFACIGFIGSLLNIISGRWSVENIISGRWLSLIDLVFYSAIGAYLLFNKKVKKVFSLQSVK